jgi:hypothetical protein
MTGRGGWRKLPELAACHFNTPIDPEAQTLRPDRLWDYDDLISCSAPSGMRSERGLLASFSERNFLPNPIRRRSNIRYG